MGFADGYLQKHAIGQPLIGSAPDPELHSIIALPAYNESGLMMSLDSLFSCDLPEAPVEVIVLINSGEQTPRAIVEKNRRVHAEAIAWSASRQRPGLTFHVVLLENLPKKHFGVGLARKLVMDEAVRRFNQVGHAAGIILSLDGDTLVEPNYMREVIGLFDRSPSVDGCAIRFEHPLDPEEEQGDQKDMKGHLEQEDMEGHLEQEGQDEQEVQRDLVGREEHGEHEEQGDMVGQEVHSAAVYDAIVNYELHQRYYLEAVRYTGYPFAYHTVGSAFAVRAAAYCRQGGMSKRQAGEDFYFIQKVAMQGNFTECNTTTVHPSARPSDRVPFGTGPAVARQLSEPGLPYLTYAPELFSHLRTFYALLPDFFACGPSLRNTQGGMSSDPSSGNLSSGRAEEHAGPVFRAAFNSLTGLLQRYLEATGFLQELTEIHRNVASETAFRQRFYRKFNMFRILKYLHFAGEQGVDKVEVGVAAREMLEMKGEAVNRNVAQSRTLRNAARKDNRGVAQSRARRNAARKDNRGVAQSRARRNAAREDNRNVTQSRTQRNATREMLEIYRRLSEE